MPTRACMCSLFLLIPTQTYVQCNGKRGHDIKIVIATRYRNAAYGSPYGHAHLNPGCARVLADHNNTPTIPGFSRIIGIGPGVPHNPGLLSR